MSLTPRARDTRGNLVEIFHTRAKYHTFLPSHSEYSHQAQDLKTSRSIQQSSQGYLKKSYTGAQNQHIQLSPPKSNRSHQAFEIETPGFTWGHGNGSSPHNTSSGRNLLESSLGRRSNISNLDLSKYSNYNTLRADRNNSQSSIEA